MHPQMHRLVAAIAEGIFAGLSRGLSTAPAATLKTTKTTGR